MTEPLKEHPLKARLLAMMVLRVAVALVFLGITTYLQLKEFSYASLNLYPLYTIVVIIGLLTIFYARIINRVRNLTLFTYAQVTVDMMLVTAIVYATGGIESYLSVLYFLSVIGSSILLNRRGGFYAASVASIAYGALIDLEYYGMLSGGFRIFSAPAVIARENVLRTIATNILAYFIVAYLTGYLAERTARAEKDLHEKGIDFENLERLNRHIVENITSGIITLDAGLRITSFNRAAEAISGLTLREVYHKELNNVFPGLIERKLFDGTSIEGGGGAPMRSMGRAEKAFTKKDSTELYLGFTVSRGGPPIDSIGGGGTISDDMAWIVIFQDLTRLKAMEEQLRRGERLKALGELSVGIAHEVRNPLASISGSIQVLKGDLDLKGEDLRLMDIVMRETGRLNALITDFLLFARPAQEKRERINIA
ncbi:MAG: PAS domain S-box protein [Deltaproteobacteria bacterium]|nr:PAS domain S-box protein [Deltaproteobacteria bacterium]